MIHLTFNCDKCGTTKSVQAKGMILILQYPDHKPGYEIMTSHITALELTNLTIHLCEFTEKVLHIDPNDLKGYVDESHN